MKRWWFRLLQLIHTLLLFWFCLTLYLACDFKAINDITPDPGLYTYEDFVADGLKAANILISPEHGKKYLIVGEQHATLLSSGPPIYVFSEQGILIDFTADSGDDPHFMEKWAIRRAHKINPSKFDKIMKITAKYQPITTSISGPLSQ